MKLSLRQLTPLLFVSCTFLFFQTVFLTANAQAPSITVESGIPSGSQSGNGVAYGGGLYVAIFGNGKAYSSTNGETWTKITDPSLAPGTYNRIEYGAGKFVIVGSVGLILSSSDGTHWTTCTSGTSNQLNDVQFIQSAFYVLGAGATMLRSADGTTWSQVVVNGSAGNIFMNITYGNGVFIIGARNAGGANMYIYQSATGASNSWTFQNVGFNPLNKVQYLKDRFYIFTSNTAVFTSPDGSTWTNSTASLPVTLPNSTTQTIGSPNQAFNGFYDGNKVYLFGYSGYFGSYGGIFSSTDGVNFTLQPISAYIVSQGSAYINNRYFQFGNEGICSSTDGINYKFPSGNYSGLASSGAGHYVAAGAIGSFGVLFNSQDFSSWSNKTPGPGRELLGVTWTGSAYIAAGNQAVTMSVDEGNTWTELATATKWFNTLTWGASKLVAGGYDVGSNNAELLYSPDGISWTVANTANLWYFKVKHVNNVFFAVGMSNDTWEGAVLYSTDGINWTDITPSLAFTTYYYNDVVYDGSKYHLMGADAGYTFFSVSSSTPAAAASWGNTGSITSPPPGSMLGGAWGEGAFAFTNGHFVGSVNDAITGEVYTVYSDDGISWTAEPSGVLGNITGALVEGSKVLMIGSGNLMITANYNLTTLPVSYVSFDASLVNNESVLRWTTATEHNSKHFVVQHSTDQGTWTRVGTVQAAGESNQSLNYRFTHSAPAEGYNYYRLIQVDLDGKQEISKVVKTKLDKLSILKFYPNPAAENVCMTLPSNDPSTIAVYNNRAQQVYFKKHTGNTIQLSMQSLPKGIYHVVVTQDGQKYTGQIIHH